MIRPAPTLLSTLITLSLLVMVGAAATETSTETAPAPETSLSASFQRGDARPLSMSVLTFAPDGTLFIGDSRGGAIFAIATAEAAADPQPIMMADVEGKIAARLGSQASDVMVHDMAVHPISHRVFLAVSMGRANWDLVWKLPNHVADASILLAINADGTIDEFSLDNVRFARSELANPIGTDQQHSFMSDVSLRTDTITDMAYTEDTLFVAGLSNEEFASTLWKVALPFSNGTSATSLEIYHGAHGAYETHAPIRTFVPYSLDGEDFIFAAYLCTPLSLFKVDELKDKTHLKGRTIAEFGSGNYPLDMVVVHQSDGDTLVIANSNLPLIMVDTRDIAAFDGAIDAPLFEYSTGVTHVKRSGSGIQQLENLADQFLITLQRTPSGTLELGALPLRRG